MKNYNIILITIDGARVDRLNISKEFKFLIDKGVFFSNMITAAPYTLASTRSIFSGLYPTKHGVNAYYAMFRFKGDKCKTMAQYFKEQGYFTQADTSNKNYIPSQGFEKLGLYDEYKEDPTNRHLKIIEDVSRLKKDFFLHLHYMDIHAKTIEKVARKYSDFDKEYFENFEKNKERYNELLITAGEYAKKLYDKIKDLGLLKNTLLVFVSDHGVSNGERVGERMYGAFTYDYTIKTFAIIMFPDGNVKEIKNLTRTIDILPTILEIFELEEDPKFNKMQGKSLLPLMNGAEEDRMAFTETGGLYGPFPSVKKPNVRCVRTNKWKLIHNETPDTWELYNVETDKDEKYNVYGKNIDIEEKLKKEMNKIIEECSS